MAKPNCVACDATVDAKKGQWWHLNNYFKFSGRFCPDCYNKISHDSYGKPQNPKEYTLMLLKLGNNE